LLPGGAAGWSTVDGVVEILVVILIVLVIYGMTTIFLLTG